MGGKSMGDDRRGGQTSFGSGATAVDGLAGASPCWDLEGRSVRTYRRSGTIVGPPAYPDTCT